MSEVASPVPAAASNWHRIGWVLLPLLVLAASIVWIITADPLQGFKNGAPPVEALTFERTVLNESGIHVQVRAGGSDPMNIAQVQVDEAERGIGAHLDNLLFMKQTCDRLFGAGTYEWSVLAAGLPHHWKRGSTG